MKVLKHKALTRYAKLDQVMDRGGNYITAIYKIVGAINNRKT